VVAGPAIDAALSVFLPQHRLEGAAPQIQIDDLRAVEGLRAQARGEQLIHPLAITFSYSNRGAIGSRADHYKSRDDLNFSRSAPPKDLGDIKCLPYKRRIRRLVLEGLPRRQHGLHLGGRQKVVIHATDEIAQLSTRKLRQFPGMAKLSVQACDALVGLKASPLQINADHLSNLRPQGPMSAVARLTEGPKPFAGVGLLHHQAVSDPFAALAPKIAGGRGLLPASAGRWMPFILYKRPSSRGLLCPIGIEDQVQLSLSVEESAQGLTAKAEFNKEGQKRVRARSTTDSSMAKSHRDNAERWGIFFRPQRVNRASAMGGTSW
jgi:hypothetical protein